MRLNWPLIFVLGPVVAGSFGQIHPVHRHPAESLPASWSPLDIPSIRYWWVSGDLLSTNFVTNWIDRIQGLDVGQATAANRPTNSAAGVHFTGSPICMSNNVPGEGFISLVNTTGSVFVVVTPITPAGTYGAILGSDATSGYGFYARNDGKFFTWGAAGNGAWGAYVSGSMLDFAVTEVGIGASSTYYYTNGVPLVTNGFTFPGGQKWFGRDHTATDFGKSFLAEVIYYSNRITATDIANLHQYATNKYGYSP